MAAPAKSSQNTAPHFAAMHNNQNPGRRGAEVNFTGAMQFYTIAKL
jgi:hypothetical protein